MERIQKKSSEREESAKRNASGMQPVNSTTVGISSSIDGSPAMAAQRKKLQGLFGGAVQLQAEEEPLQGKFEAIQRVEEEEPLQGKFDAASSVQLKEEAAKPNNTGLPDNLKSGIESLSGMSMDNVKVHYNSSQPAQLNAHAYAQGTDIHVAPGQEQHLPHEAWHVVQQAQGRVKPTMQMKGGVPVNDDAGLENEADVMGERALTITKDMNLPRMFRKSSPGDGVAQRVVVTGNSKYVTEDVSKNTLYRGSSSLTPQNAFASGHDKSGNAYSSILLHILNNGLQSKWVSTTSSRDVAEGYAGNGGWVYMFNGISQPGLDANKAYEKHKLNKDEIADCKDVNKKITGTNPFAWQMETSIWEKVAGKDIVGVGAYSESNNKWNYYTRYQIEVKKNLPQDVLSRL